MNAQRERIAAAAVSIWGGIIGGSFLLWVSTLIWTGDRVLPELIKAEAFLNGANYVPISMWTIGGIAEYAHSLLVVVFSAIVPFVLPIVGAAALCFGIFGLLASLGIEPAKKWLPIGRRDA